MAEPRSNSMPQPVYVESKVRALTAAYGAGVDAVKAAHEYIHGGQDRGLESEQRYGAWLSAYEAFRDAQAALTAALAPAHSGRSGGSDE